MTTFLGSTADLCLMSQLTPLGRENRMEFLFRS